ncbi:hypothetical protein KIF53_08585 [Chromobacterium subtsugae]|uniref:Uncharacterized protein n=1 Tax=Chromobacterium subtsugae TaxID=251747 RepID=A0ABS7FC75_9NEIS|nr:MULTISPECIES: hypothetical protein [Chromobacterium]MBW7566456.1 hypothetical protein [Chromobacterium subtsugae]MBW8287685.1 hypothetical protein [Chromobacterium subtsugae]WSE91017.1 hypothetical protein U6115_19370 [Chromobacterium subtsugae]WVH59391.1 hypothetical protein U6151_19400 [Chromobacterium subtsugae]
MKPSDYDLHLDQLKKNSVDRLLCREDFSLTAFNDLYQYLCQKAVEIRSEHVVSKQVIATILSAKQTIENNSSTNIDAHKNIDLANKFLFLLEMIAINEEPADRTPGVPRII